MFLSSQQIANFPKKPDDVTININYYIIILNKIISEYNLNTNKINFLFYLDIS